MAFGYVRRRLKMSAGLLKFALGEAMAALLW
jgi:hypothetical protein